MQHPPLTRALSCLSVLLLSLTSHWLPAQAPYKATTDSMLLRLNASAERLLYINPDSSIYYSLKARERADHLDDDPAMTRALIYLGKAYYIKGSYEQSLKYTTTGMALAEKIGDKHNLASGYNGIGLIYLGHDQYDLALQEFRKAVDLAGTDGDSSHIAAYLFNAGICFDQTGEFAKALTYLNRAMISDKGQHVSLMSLNRLGETWLHMKQFDTAVRYYRQLLKDPRSADDSWEKAFAYAGLAQASYARGQFDSAAAQAHASLNFARQIHAKWDAERAAKILADSYAALHQYQKAHEYMVIDKLYNDSLYSDSREQVVNFLKLQQREKENRQLKDLSGIDQRTIQLRTVLLIGACLLAALLIALALVFYRNYKVKHKLSRQLETSNQLKDQMFSVISHDLRSPMAAMQQMLELMKARHLSEGEKNKLYDMFYRQVILNNNMLNNLLQWVTTQLTGPGIIAKKEELDPSQIIDEVLSVYTYLAGQKKIMMTNEVSTGMTIRGDKEQLKIIFQNIIGNAVKFTNPGGTIRLFHTIHDDTVTLHVKDDGVGIPAPKLATLLEQSGPSLSTYGTAREKGTGIGLYLVRQFVERNDGKIHISSAENMGTETCVSFACVGLKES
ncbi:MAG TPA: ATP-binding protein [Puia sp.]|nr:ATP-binding protein [Puia sp.]